jgi:hypothetical protein
MMECSYLKQGQQKNLMTLYTFTCFIGNQILSLINEYAILLLQWESDLLSDDRIHHYYDSTGTSLLIYALKCCTTVPFPSATSTTP